jgi:hypothetical protein
MCGGEGEVHVHHVGRDRYNQRRDTTKGGELQRCCQTRLPNSDELPEYLHTQFTIVSSVRFRLFHTHQQQEDAEKM